MNVITLPKLNIAVYFIITLCSSRFSLFHFYFTFRVFYIFTLMLIIFHILGGGAKNKTTKPIRWPWIVITIMICALDLTATSIYANDTFHTRVSYRLR